MGESGHCMKLQGLYFAIVCEIEYSIMQKGLLTLFAPAYMGQFLQDGKNDQTLSKKNIFCRFTVTKRFDFFNFSQLFWRDFVLYILKIVLFW